MNRLSQSERSKTPRELSANASVSVHPARDSVIVMSCDFESSSGSYRQTSQKSYKGLAILMIGTMKMRTVKPTSFKEMLEKTFSASLVLY